MYALPLTITLLTVIALAHCGTLRQYGRDWLIPKPEPQVDAKRITAKSVFIAPSFNAENVRCGAGFRQDASGRCVKLVHVNQAAQLDFLLQRLNAMYGAPVVNHSEKQPLQVTVDIPVESVNASTSMEAEVIYSHFRPPSGEVSIDLLSNIAEQMTEDTDDGKTTEDSLEHQVPNGQSFLPESEENETDVIIMPSKEIFQVDEEPIVTLIDLETEGEDGDGDSTQNSPPLDANKSTKFEDLFESDEDKPAIFISDEAGVMAAVAKNVSNVIKKETLQGSDSVQIFNDTEIKGDSGATLLNKTQSDLSKVDEVLLDENYGNKTKKPSKPYANNSEDAMIELSSGDRIDTNKIETDDKMRNELLHPANTNSINETSSEVNETATDSESTQALTSTEESTDFTTETMAANVTSTEHSASSLAAQNETTFDSKFPTIALPLPISETQDGYVEPTEQKITVSDDMHKEDTDQVVDMNTEYGDSDSDYEYREVDVEAEDYDDDVIPEDVNVNEDESHSVPTEASAIQGMLISANNRVENNSSEGSFDSASGDGDVSEHEYSGDLEDVSVIFNHSTSLNSTKAIQKTESENSYNVPSKNGTNLSEILSFSDGGDRTPSKSHSHVSGGSASHFETSSVKINGDEVLTADSSIHNVNTGPQNLPEKLPTGSEEVQQVVISQHSVHVVYPQPIIQVMNVKQESHGHTLGVANSNEPKTKPKETDDLNSPHHQFHNLSPKPLQHHNSHPVSQVPLPAEKVPEDPYTFNGSPFPAQSSQSQHPYPPYHQFHPHPARPHPPHRDGQGGFVRFPTDQAQDYHRSHPQAHAHRQDAVRFPQEESRTNDKYSRWGAWGLDEGRGASPQQRLWSPPENRRSYWASNRPTRRRPQLSYY